MGVLRDTEYWNDVVQQMVPFRPVGTQPPSPDDTRRLLTIACHAFSKLVNDPELQADLAQMIGKASQAAKELPEDTAALRGYLKAFRQVEIEILRSAKVPETAITVMDEEIAALVGRPGVDWNDFDDVEGRLRFIQQKVCSCAADPNFAKDPAPELRKLVFDACAATLVGAADLGVIGVSAAAAVAAAPVVAPAAAAAAAGGAAGAGALAALSLVIPLGPWKRLGRHFGW